MSVARGQRIEKSQLDALAALANSKLTPYEINGVLRDGDTVPFNIEQHNRGEYINVTPRLDATRAFEFDDDSGWRSELIRIRANLRRWIEYDLVRNNRSELLPYLAVGGPWPIKNSYGNLNAVKVWSRDIINENDTYYVVTGRLYDTVQYYALAQDVTFRIEVVAGESFEASAYLNEADAITTETVYRYDVFVPEKTQERTASCIPSNRNGMWLLRLPMFTPNFNPFSADSHWINYDERIERFASIMHRAMSPYTELPTPYPPAPSTENAKDYYEGLANYYHSRTDRPDDPSGPHSPSRSSYYRIPSYPTRKKSDGVYAPFYSEAISRNDFGGVIQFGMIYSVTMSRTDASTQSAFSLWQHVSGEWRRLYSETLNAGVKSKTIYPLWPVFSDAPIYWEGPDTGNVQATFVARGLTETGIHYDVSWPIHSCYYNDTEALLNLI